MSIKQSIYVVLDTSQDNTKQQKLRTEPKLSIIDQKEITCQPSGHKELEIPLVHESIFELKCQEPPGFSHGEVQSQMKEESTMVFDLKEGMIVKLRNGNYAVVANLDTNRAASPQLQPWGVCQVDKESKDGEYRLISWDYIKWYSGIEGFKDVDFFENLDDYNIEYDFVRIGEDMGDYEEEGDLCSGLICPSQNIWFDDEYI